MYSLTNEEIKKEKHRLFLRIKYAEEDLAKLRAQCPHEKTYEGNYSARLGDIKSAVICEYCGELIKYLWENIISAKTK